MTCSRDSMGLTNEKVLLGRLRGREFHFLKEERNCAMACVGYIFLMLVGSSCSWLMLAPDLSNESSIYWTTSRDLLSLVICFLQDHLFASCDWCRCCFAGDVESVLHKHHYKMMCLYVVWQLGKIRLHQKIVSVGYLHSLWNSVRFVLVKKKIKHICCVKQIINNNNPLFQF